MGIFKKNKLNVDDLVDVEVKNPAANSMSDLTDCLKTSENTTKQEDEWIWVTGYKGTDKDMCCRGFQYEIGKKFNMDENARIKECESGFHLCLKLDDVYNFYEIKDGNRFFEVRALVRKSDAEKYGSTDYLDMYYAFLSGTPKNKLAAKSIEFVRELTVDEILEGSAAADWPPEDKKLALNVSIAKAEHMRHKDTLLKMGYSETFVEYLIDTEKTKIALVVGSQPDLSMDMKVWAIMK